MSEEILAMRWKLLKLIIVKVDDILVFGYDFLEEVDALQALLWSRKQRGDWLRAGHDGLEGLNELSEVFVEVALAQLSVFSVWRLVHYI